MLIVNLIEYCVVEPELVILDQFICFIYTAEHIVILDIFIHVIKKCLQRLGNIIFLEVGLYLVLAERFEIINVDILPIERNIRLNIVVEIIV